MVATSGGITALVSVQMIEAEQRDDHRCGPARHVQDACGRASRCPRASGSRCFPTRSAISRNSASCSRRPEGVAILTDGPKDEVAAVEQPFLLIAIAPGEAPKPEERDAFARRAVLQPRRASRTSRSRAPSRCASARRRATRSSPTPRMRPPAPTSRPCSGCASDRTPICRCSRSSRSAAWNDVFPRLRAIRDSIEPR